MKADLIGILEASYRVDQTEPAWLDGVLEVLGPELDQGRGLTAFFYDASDVNRLRIREVRGRGADRDALMAAAAMEKSPPHRVAWTFRTAVCGLASEGPDWAITPVREVFRGWGIEDVLFLNAVEPRGLGCFVTAPMRTAVKLTKARRQRWERVAAHLAAGYRLMRRAEAEAEPAVDAVLTPDGKVEDASGEATERTARDRLRQAVRAIDRARGPERATDPDGSVGAWTPLTDGRWTLVEHFESDGKRYVLARRNEADVPTLEDLSPRERQVLGYVALGHPNKFVAYELGIAPPTVAVLLMRAARKLGTGSRGELVAKFNALREQAGARG